MSAPKSSRRTGLTVRAITLGCDKNTVDTERFLAGLIDRGVAIATPESDPDIIVVNSCGFIDAAKAESIEALVEAGRLKAEGRCKAVVGMGCMVQRHKDELLEALPEVDVFLGTSEADRLIPELEERGLLDADDAAPLHPGVRVYSGELPHIRYLKISEGCDHGCAFCAIPLMRGLHRSFAPDAVVAEAQLLEAQGAREVNLVAQDLAHWGRDRREQGQGLPDLLEMLLQETTIPWFRLLYIYSAGLTPRLLDLMARDSRIVPYLDIPIQHASDAVLSRMRRPERARTIRDRVAKIRAAVPHVGIRTTCIVGFPGETDEDFEALLAFLEEIRFDRVGVFAYSAQEGTRAAAMVDDVPHGLKLERVERVNELQRLVTSDIYAQRIGMITRAIVDQRLDGQLVGRTVWQGHDIDGVTVLSGAIDAQPGAIVDVRLTEVLDDVDLAGEIVKVVSSPGGSSARRRSALPVMAGAGGPAAHGR